MKKIMTTMLAFLLLLSLINAGTQFYMVKNDLGNKTIQNRMTICYDKSFQAVLTDIRDYTTGNNFYQTYILYNLYVNKWNTDNPNYIIDYCNMTIKQSTRQTNYSTIFNKYVTNNDFDLFNAKYFLLMADGDCVIVEQNCRYNSNYSQSNLDIPAYMQLVTPTWECKDCQYYEWTLTQRDIAKAELLNNNKLSISDFMKKLILINFEILLILFWTFMILMIFVAIGFIFMGIYWLFLYLRGVAK
jgi:hypothetical protein